MSIGIEIRGPGSVLNIEVLGYENPESQNQSDANWLSCTVSAKVGQFSANFNASFTTYDFARFRNELSEVMTKLSGRASFVTDEDQLHLSVNMGNTGNVVIEGVTQEYGMPKASLSFSFDSDQSYLRSTLQELEDVVGSFPVKELAG